jgi:hypothetical protein
MVFFPPGPNFLWSGTHLAGHASKGRLYFYFSGPYGKGKNKIAAGDRLIARASSRKILVIISYEDLF